MTMMMPLSSFCYRELNSSRYNSKRHSYESAQTMPCMVLEEHIHIRDAILKQYESRRSTMKCEGTSFQWLKMADQEKGFGFHVKNAPLTSITFKLFQEI